MSNPQGVADSGAYHLMSSELTTLLRRDFNWLEKKTACVSYIYTVENLEEKTEEKRI